MRVFVLDTMYQFSAKMLFAKQRQYTLLETAVLALM